MERRRKTIIDPICPWKLPRLRWALRGSLTASPSEWHALLGRAKQGDPTAEWEIAERYADGCKDKAGRVVVRRSARREAEWLRRAAEHGCREAQNNLGILLGNGRGALVWLRKAWRNGNTGSAANIAITYRQSGNFRRAVHWFRKSVASGDDDALVQLGIHYYWGKGVKKNPTPPYAAFGGRQRERISAKPDETMPSSTWDLRISRVKA